MIFLEINSFNDFLATNSWWIALTIAIVLVLTMTIIFLSFYFAKKNPKNLKKVNIEGLFVALGGKENIISSTPKKYELVIKLQDYKLVNEKKLKKSGVCCVVLLKDNIILNIDDDPILISNLLAQ